MREVPLQAADAAFVGAKGGRDVGVDGTSTTVAETLPAKRFRIGDLRGAETTWHQVVERDPTD